MNGGLVSIAVRRGTAALFFGLLATAAFAGPTRLYSNNNIEAVRNGPTEATVFRLNSAAMVSHITTYHWNGGRGTPTPGTIALRAASGDVLGPWDAVGEPGQGGANNAYWIAHPNVTLEAGDYTVIVSDPATWSHNVRSGNAGIAWIDGYPQ